MFQIGLSVVPLNPHSNVTLPPIAAFVTVCGLWIIFILPERQLDHFKIILCYILLTTTDCDSHSYKKWEVQGVDNCHASKRLFQFSTLPSWIYCQQHFCYLCAYEHQRAHDINARHVIVSTSQCFDVLAVSEKASTITYKFWELKEEI